MRTEMLLWNRYFVVEIFWVLAYVQYRDFGKKKNEKKKKILYLAWGFSCWVAEYTLCFFFRFGHQSCLPYLFTRNQKVQGAQFACGWT
jgi:uncharacterized membrane protein